MFALTYSHFAIYLEKRKGTDMNTKATVVIGANYGDEGKGLMTDYFSAQSDSSLVIRFNGGCQAGHTVTTPDGRRHVFSHFGSGLFAGASTYLSKHYAVNPVLYLKERARLGQRPPGHILYVDRRAPVTTFYDMLVNQMAEEARGVKKHGSCGMGFGETVGRQDGGTHALEAGDLVHVDRLRQKLLAIRDEHLPARCAALGLPGYGAHHDLCTTDVLVDAFIEAARHFLADAALLDGPRALVPGYDNLVFEGAQGLLLDQTRGDFPHVTRSNTGLANALEVAADAGVRQLEVTYVTRTYLTRHGAGPLHGELHQKPYPGVVDLTNLPNEYQGALRFAYLNHDQLKVAINTDMTAARQSGLDLTASLAVTCLDQVGDTAFFWKNGSLEATSLADQLHDLSSVLPIGHTSEGPRRDQVTCTE